MARVTTEEIRAEEARRIIEAPIYKEAYRVMEERLINELAQAEISEDRITRVRNLLVALRKTRVYLEQIMVSGKMAALEAERKSIAQTFIEKAQRFSIM